MTSSERPDPTEFSDVLPIGKLSTDVLRSMLDTVSISDDAVLVGPGIGRDAAVIDLGDLLLVLKTDPITFVTDQAAHYLVNVNSNDLACLGVDPRWMLVSAMFPADTTTIAHVSTVFADLEHACAANGIALVGGHTEVTAAVCQPVLTGLLAGVATPSTLLMPGNASPGDRIIVAGPIATEGTTILARSFRAELVPVFGAEMVDRAASFLTDPGISIGKAAKTLRAASTVTAMHDPTEGGLVTGIRELAEASNCGAVISRDLVPIHPETAAFASYFGIDPLGLIASGSLLAAVAPDAVATALEALSQVGIDASVIGKLTSPERGFNLSAKGAPAEFPAFEVDELARLFAIRQG